MEKDKSKINITDELLIFDTVGAILDKINIDNISNNELLNYVLMCKLICKVFLTSTQLTLNDYLRIYYIDNADMRSNIIEILAKIIKINNNDLLKLLLDTNNYILKNSDKHKQILELIESFGRFTDMYEDKNCDNIIDEFTKQIANVEIKNIMINILNVLTLNKTICTNLNTEQKGGRIFYKFTNKINQINSNYRQKYLKYKQKYLELKRNIFIE
jgi:hypothetical protein